MLIKHCQRDNGPEGWVLLTKVSCSGDITRSNTNFLSNLIWGISTKHQTSASQLNLNFKILSKPSFKISTKIQLHNLYKSSATKYWQNSSFKSCLSFNFKILTKPCVQSLNKSLALSTSLSSQICNKSVAKTIFIIKSSNSNTLNKFWVGKITRQVCVNQV